MSVAVKVPTTTVSVLAIAGGRRLLAAEITVSYSVRAYSGMSTDKLIANLHSSVDTGAFLIALKADSGLPIISMSGTVTTNLTPTASPTSSPLPSSEGECCAVIAIIVELTTISVFPTLVSSHKFKPECHVSVRMYDHPR